MGVFHRVKTPDDRGVLWLLSADFVFFPVVDRDQAIRGEPVQVEPRQIVLSLGPLQQRLSRIRFRCFRGGGRACQSGQVFGVGGERHLRIIASGDDALSGTPGHPVEGWSLEKPERTTTPTDLSGTPRMRLLS